VGARLKLRIQTVIAALEVAVAASSNIKLRTLAMDYKLLVKKLHLQIPLVDPIICIAKIANKAHLTETTKLK
jgi:transcription initiation factor TFIIB